MEKKTSLKVSVFTCGTQVLKQSFQNHFYVFDPPPPTPKIHLEVFRQACFNYETPKNFPVYFPLKRKFFSSKHFSYVFLGH